GLNNLDGQRHRRDSGNADQQAATAGIVDESAVANFFELGLDPILVGRRLGTSPAAAATLRWSRSDIWASSFGVLRADGEGQSAGSAALPDARHVRFAIRSSRNG